MTNSYRTDPVVFALALQHLEGVGRVTAGRLSRLFGSYAALRLYPREQILTRLKGIPKAASLVATLHDEAVMDTHLEQAAATLQTLGEKQITAHLTHQPPLAQRFAALTPSDAPLLLYTHGEHALLESPWVALVGAPSTATAPLLNALLGTLRTANLTCCLGIDEPSTSAVLKLLLQQEMASSLVTASGLGRLPRPQRGLASATVRGGGVLVAPFAHDHGPYPHDLRERLTTQIALAAATVFVEPTPHTATWHALTQAVERVHPTFVMGRTQEPLPRATQQLNNEADLAWIPLAIQAQTT